MTKPAMQIKMIFRGCQNSGKSTAVSALIGHDVTNPSSFKCTKKIKEYTLIDKTKRNVALRDTTANIHRKSCTDDTEEFDVYVDDIVVDSQYGSSFTLIDTPGFKTYMEMDTKLENNNADIIFLVLCSTYQGTSCKKQDEILNAIEKIQPNDPKIILINKKDLIDDDEDEERIALVEDRVKKVLKNHKIQLVRISAKLILKYRSYQHLSEAEFVSKVKVKDAKQIVLEWKGLDHANQLTEQEVRSSAFEIIRQGDFLNTKLKEAGYHDLLKALHNVVGGAHNQGIVLAKQLLRQQPNIEGKPSFTTTSFKKNLVQQKKLTAQVDVQANLANYKIIFSRILEQSIKDFKECPVSANGLVDCCHEATAFDTEIAPLLCSNTSHPSIVLWQEESRKMLMSTTIEVLCSKVSDWITRFEGDLAKKRLRQPRTERYTTPLDWDDLTADEIVCELESLIRKTSNKIADLMPDDCSKLCAAKASITRTIAVEDLKKSHVKSLGWDGIADEFNSFLKTQEQAAQRQIIQNEIAKAFEHRKEYYNKDFNQVFDASFQEQVLPEINILKENQALIIQRIAELRTKLSSTKKRVPETLDTNSPRKKIQCLNAEKDDVPHAASADEEMGEVLIVEKT